MRRNDRTSVGVIGLMARLWRALALGFVIACSLQFSMHADDEHDHAPPDDADSAATIEKFGHGHRLAFAPCAEDPSLECATLIVPVDYRKPWGGTVDLAVIRARATSPGKRIGILVGNPGGPGESGVDFLLGVSHLPVVARLREHFDVLSFDPRGVSRSRGVRCTVELPPLPPASDDDALTAYFDDYSRRYASACFAQNGPFVNHIGTMNTARDMDVLRQALGERQLTYAAGSYGTALGAAYATLFPERVRAMMLDGAVMPEFTDYLVEFASEFSASFELTFQRLDALCRHDAACALAQSGVVAAFDEVAARLESTPVPLPGGAMLTRDDLSNVVATLLDREALWPAIVNALSAARAGDYSQLADFAPVVGRESGSLVPIHCNDYGTRRSAADYLRIDEAVGGRHPRFFGRFNVAFNAASCAAWPAAEPIVVRNVQKRMETPILFLGNDFDTRTPISSTRRLARALGFEHSVLRYAGAGHTAFFTTTACVQDTVVDYLVERRLPEEGFVCPGRPIDFGASLVRTPGPVPAPQEPGWRFPLPGRPRTQ